MYIFLILNTLLCDDMNIKNIETMILSIHDYVNIYEQNMDQSNDKCNSSGNEQKCFEKTNAPLAVTKAR